MQCFGGLSKVSQAEEAIECTLPMQVKFTALHDVPAGEEITQSYFPLNVDYKQRQQRLQGDYGFTCTCPRCQVCMIPHRKMPD